MKGCGVHICTYCKCMFLVKECVDRVLCLVCPACFVRAVSRMFCACSVCHVCFVCPVYSSGYILLYLKGVTMDTAEGPMHMRGSIASFVCDILGSQAIGGFEEGGSALCPCRHCMVTQTCKVHVANEYRNTNFLLPCLLIV